MFQPYKHYSKGYHKPATYPPLRKQSEILKEKQKRPNQDREDLGEKRRRQQQQQQEEKKKKTETTGYGGEEPRRGRHKDKDRKKGRWWGRKTGEGKARKNDREEGEGEGGLPEEMHSIFETEMRKKVQNNQGTLVFVFLSAKQ